MQSTGSIPNTLYKHYCAISIITSCRLELTIQREASPAHMRAMFPILLLGHFDLRSIWVSLMILWVLEEPLFYDNISMILRGAGWCLSILSRWYQMVFGWIVFHFVCFFIVVVGRKLCFTGHFLLVSTFWLKYYQIV